MTLHFRTLSMTAVVLLAAATWLSGRIPLTASPVPKAKPPTADKIRQAAVRHLLVRDEQGGGRQGGARRPARLEVRVGRGGELADHRRTGHLPDDRRRHDRRVREGVATGHPQQGGAGAGGHPRRPSSSSTGTRSSGSPSSRAKGGISRSIRTGGTRADRPGSSRPNGTATPSTGCKPCEYLQTTPPK